MPAAAGRLQQSCERFSTALRRPFLPRPHPGRPLLWVQGRSALLHRQRAMPHAGGIRRQTHIASNTVLQLLPGRHKKTSYFQVQNVEYVTIEGDLAALAPVLVSKSMAGPGGLLVTASPSETSNVEITGVALENLRVMMRRTSNVAIILCGEIIFFPLASGSRD